VDAGEEVTDREVDVLGLGFRDGRWTIAAWCRLRRGQRLFLAERVRSARVTARRAARFGRPPFDARAFACAAWLDPGAGPELATVRLAAPLSPAWPALFPGALSERLPGGARLCHVRVSRPRGLAALVASLGGRAVIVGAGARPPRPVPRPGGGGIG
jgi:predicted DNA-binding transcriptional regulator YafY